MPKKLKLVPIVKKEKKEIPEFTTGNCYHCHSELKYKTNPVRVPTGELATPCLKAVWICDNCREDPKSLKETRKAAEKHFQEDHKMHGLME